MLERKTYNNLFLKWSREELKKYIKEQENS